MGPFVTLLVAMISCKISEGYVCTIMVLFLDGLQSLGCCHDNRELKLATLTSASHYNFCLCVETRMDRAFHTIARCEMNTYLEFEYCGDKTGC